MMATKRHRRRKAGTSKRCVVGRDSVEPSKPPHAVRAKRASSVSGGCAEMLAVLASLRSKWGSTESRPTGALGQTRPTVALSPIPYHPFPISHPPSPAAA